MAFCEICRSRSLSLNTILFPHTFDVTVQTILDTPTKCLASPKRQILQQKSGSGCDGRMKVVARGLIAMCSLFGRTVDAVVGTSQFSACCVGTPKPRRTRARSKTCQKIVRARETTAVPPSPPCKPNQNETRKLLAPCSTHRVLSGL